MEPVKRILLTGGNGYLGSRVANACLKRKDQVFLLKRKESNLSRLDLSDQSLNIIELDDFEGGDFDCFIHMATSYGRKGESAKEIEEANIYFPLSLLEKIETGNLHFINIGTSLPESLNNYARTKHVFIEKLKNDYQNISITNFILEQFFGPKDGTFVSFIIDNLLKSDSIDLTLGEQFRDFIYVDDVVSAIIHAVDKKLEGDFSLGLGEKRTIRSVVESLQKILKKEDVNLNFGAIPYRENELMNSCADLEALRKTGWEPQWSFEEALEDLIKKI